ncbi:MAG: hypothetical protein AAB226_05250 [candidate division NC10 bacterium]
MLSLAVLGVPDEEPAAGADAAEEAESVFPAVLDCPSVPEVGVDDDSDFIAFFRASEG